MCKTAVKIVIYKEGLSETGAPLIALEDNLKCNYQDRAYTKMTAEQKIVTLGAKAYFCEDICPELPTISDGIVTVFGVDRKIYQGTKARNPDGTVNYTLLELI